MLLRERGGRPSRQQPRSWKPLRDQWLIAIAWLVLVLDCSPIAAGTHTYDGDSPDEPVTRSLSYGERRQFLAVVSQAANLGISDVRLGLEFVELKDDPEIFNGVKVRAFAPRAVSEANVDAIAYTKETFSFASSGGAGGKAVVTAKSWSLIAINEEAIEIYTPLDRESVVYLFDLMIHELSHVRQHRFVINQVANFVNRAPSQAKADAATRKRTAELVANELLRSTPGTLGGYFRRRDLPDSVASVPPGNVMHEAFAYSSAFVVLAQRLGGINLPDEDAPKVQRWLKQRASDAEAAIALARVRLGKAMAPDSGVMMSGPTREFLAKFNPDKKGKPGTGWAYPLPLAWKTTDTGQPDWISQLSDRLAAVRESKDIDALSAEVNKLTNKAHSWDALMAVASGTVEEGVW